MSTTSHVCLVGAPLCRNWALVQRLAGRHHLTLLVEIAASDLERLTVFDVVALDCRQFGGAGAMELVSALRRVSDLPIVVLDGALQKPDVARLFSAGAQDYFSEPFNVTLIAERLEHLADSNYSKRAGIVEERP